MLALHPVRLIPMAIAEIDPRFYQKEIEPEYREFEGVKIQWNKVPWNFDHPQKGRKSIDSYSIWNPLFHEEITDRLASGQRCAMYLMGNFGVAEVRGFEEKKEDDLIFIKVKKRDRMQTLVVFSHPDEIEDVIDSERLPEEFKKISSKGERLSLYSGPMHVILPIKPEKLPDLGTIRDTQEAAFFWMPGHYGYEELAKKMKGKVNGFLAGGSLNIHGQEPCFTTSELKDGEMTKHPEWQENIDFVVLDEISESANIARSHTQVSFMHNPPKVLRLGSMSPLKILRDTGIKYDFDKKAVKLASSKTSYNNTNNEDSDRKVEIALARMARFKNFLENQVNLRAL
jgi:tRNA A37 threonylcarbamoyladenosine synthetase subunit TsaC/SUA5/YrdC